MASYTPTITVTSSPAVQVTMAGAITYDEFINTLGLIYLLVDYMYLIAQTSQEINGPFAYTIYDANGVLRTDILKPRIDPYAFQAAIYLSIKWRKFIFNGLSYLTLLLAPGESLTIELYAHQTQPQDAYQNNNVDNMAQVSDNLGNYENYRKQMFKPFK